MKNRKTVNFKDPILSRPIVIDGKVTITSFAIDFVAKEYRDNIAGRYVEYGREIIVYPGKSYSGKDAWSVGYKVEEGEI